MTIAGLWRYDGWQHGHGLHRSSMRAVGNATWVRVPLIVGEFCNSWILSHDSMMVSQKNSNVCTASTMQQKNIVKELKIKIGMENPIQVLVC